MHTDASSLVICEHCDAVYRRRLLACGERAMCVRCGAVLYRHQRLGVNSVLALSVTGLIVLLIANLAPIVTIAVSGVSHTTTLWGAIIAAWHEHAKVVAALAAVALFVAPLFQFVLLAWTCAFVRIGRRPPGLIQVVRGLQWLRPWSMIEVLMLGILVAVVKLQSVFDVSADAGLWAFAVLMVLVTLVASWDARRLWDDMPEACT
ncbi:MAG TPA: paraquat-inducible protein A [Oleiagrimonas sp.]|nr:paraquat-inducible protein A [Oleiagrimonas sp.]